MRSIEWAVVAENEPGAKAVLDKLIEYCLPKLTKEMVDGLEKDRTSIDGLVASLKKT